MESYVERLKTSSFFVVFFFLQLTDFLESKINVNEKVSVTGNDKRNVLSTEGKRTTSSAVSVSSHC